MEENKCCFTLLQSTEINKSYDKVSAAVHLNNVLFKLILF